MVVAEYLAGNGIEEPKGKKHWAVKVSGANFGNAQDKEQRLKEETAAARSWEPGFRLVSRGSDSK